MQHYLYHGLQAVIVGLVVSVFVWSGTLLGLLAIAAGVLHYWQIGSLGRSLRDTQLRLNAVSVLAGHDIKGVSIEIAHKVLKLQDCAEARRARDEEVVD